MLLTWLLVLLAGLYALPGNAADTTSASRQILVMLHLPVPHYRPGHEYGGAYGDLSGQRARRRIAAEIARKFGLTLLSSWPMPALNVDCFIMQSSSSQRIADILQRVSRDPHVEWTQALQTFHGLGQPDPLYTTQPSARGWHLRELHRISTGRDIRIAVIDSAVDDRHPDLIGQVVESRNFVDARTGVAEFHGTEVAGIIAALEDNGIGISGIAPQARLVALRACWEVAAGNTMCNSFTLAKAMQFAIDDDIKIVNLSLSGPQDTLLARLLDVALDRDIAVVAAADANVAGGGFPASYPGVFAVRDERAQVDPAVGDSIKRWPELIAPGSDIPATVPGGRWDYVSGSSFAAAHVSGMIALVKQIAPHADMRERKSWVLFPVGRGNGLAGTVDACATLRLSASALSCSGATDQAMRGPW